MTETAFARLTDEELAARAANNVDEAERTLLERYMQAIYWLPQRSFGADAEDLSGFLIFALEKIRERHILAKFDPANGARFSTWFGVVIRNLYLDYLRSESDRPGFAPLDPDATPDPRSATPGEDAGGDEDEAEASPEIIRAMEIKCRALFKILLANSFYLEPEELRWIAATSGRSIVEATVVLSRIEEDLREADAEIEARYQKLETVYWWKRTYERQLYALEQRMALPPEERGAQIEKTCRKLQKRREQQERLLEELSGASGLATTPYRRMAELLRMKEGTLGSHLTRCRQSAARFLAERED